MLDKDSLKPVIESLIFAAENAISFERIAGVLEGEDKAAVRAALNELIEDYRTKGGGFFIEEVANGYQFRTNPEFAPFLRRFFKIGLQKISKAAMETLAVVAYRQPVARGDIEAVRGVDSGGVLATLMEKRFIKIVGRKEAPGRPVVYGTTKEFLETFELKDLSCLPSLKDLTKMEEEYAREEGQGAEEDGAGGAVRAEGSPEGGESAEERARDSAPEGDGRSEERGEALEAGEEGEADISGPEEGPEADGFPDGEGGGWEESEEGSASGGAATGEAPEDNSERGDNLTEEGRGDDNRGPGEGEREGSN
ncbi:MAG: SMC-Scp complex subunit ScpB [Thermodesulfobacteriota bacterium]|nr:MAG: SMC-Scp complex subunit ScpB [Thermodesulfobacteriota bacterium]